MVHYPPADTTTPLIIVGPPRSGTRFITNVLNAVPGVTIHGEIPAPIIKKVLEVVTKCDLMYAQDQFKNSAHNWNVSKRDFMYAAWANLNKNIRKKSDKNSIYYGYKTPYHETFFDAYNNFFSPIIPTYICCIRSFIDHFLSVNARWPERPIGYVGMKYISSLRQIRHMKSKYPDNVILFFLDEYKHKGIEYLNDNIFSPLKLIETQNAVQKAKKGPVNTSKNLGVKKAKSLTYIQKLFLNFFQWPIKEFESLRNDFY